MSGSSTHIWEGGARVSFLSLRDVNTYYGESHILQNASLEVEQGRMTTLLGRNGMGKTTLMRTITGLTPPKSGEIEFDHKRVDRLQPHEIYALGVGYVPQGRHVFPYLTVHENLRMGLKNKGQRKSAVLDRMFDLFPILRERLKQKAGTLSGGEQQQLAIARALAGEVRLLLLDEPTEGIQPSIVDEILGLLVRINKEEGLTVFLVEQNMELALSVAHDFYILQKGQVVEGGTVASMDKEAVIKRYLVV
jgi:urea transport system ATP-binding protein